MAGVRRNGGREKVRSHTGGGGDKVAKIVRTYFMNVLLQIVLYKLPVTFVAGNLPVTYR